MENKKLSDTKLRREALISPFKTKEFGRWILVEHEDTRT
jgi:hypothetical protein